MKHEMDSMFKHAGFGSDPFKNDPFFNRKDDIFGDMNHIMKQMRSNLKPIGFGDMSDGRFE